MRVHQRMRNGYQESIYHNCLIIEFGKAGIKFQNEVELPVFYENAEVGGRRNFGSKSLEIKRLINNKVDKSL